MNTEVEMTIDERYKYLRKMRQRYRVAERQARGKLLDEMQAITGLHRKSLIRHMNGSLERKLRTQERQKEYGPDVDVAIGVIARSLDYPSAERLTPKLRPMAEHLAKHGELQVSAAVLKQLAQVSISTVERRLKRWPSDLARRKRIPSRSASSCAGRKPHPFEDLLFRTNNPLRLFGPSRGSLSGRLFRPGHRGARL